MTTDQAQRADLSQICRDAMRTPESMSEQTDPVSRFAPGFPRMVKPDDLGFFDQLLGEAAIIRDEDMRICWCNQAYIRLGKSYTREQIIGSRMTDFMSPIAATERERAFRAVIESEKPSAHINFCGDKRLLIVILPIDKEAFGNRGVLILIKDAPIGSALEISESLPMMSTPCLNELDALSARELEVFYHISSGLSNSEIADNLFRAVKTVENHVASIHRKLRTTNRSKLVRYGVERGIHAFTSEQWKILIDGAQRIRKNAS